MAVKRYRLENPLLSWEATVEIDHEKADADIKSSVEFWGNWERNLRDHDGDYTLAFLHSLAFKLVCMGFSRGVNLRGMIAEMKEGEGWPDLDGSTGILLANFQEPLIDENDFNVEEIG